MATCSEKDLIFALAACYTLTGLRLDNRPDKDQAPLLRGFIRTSFGGNSLAEMKLAFVMAVAGKLDLSEDDLNHYQDFNAKYFSRIMNAYLRHASQTIRQAQNTRVEPPTDLRSLGPVPTMPPVPTMDLKDCFDLYRKNLLPWKTIDIEVYHAAAKANQWHPDHWTSFESDVRQAMCKELEALKLVQPANEQKIDAQIKLTMKGGYQDRIAELARKWSVKVWFEALMAGGKEL